MSDDDEQQQQQYDEPAAVASPVREHSYLPGTSNPLFPASLLEQQRQRHITDGRSDEGLHELAILELEGVVLFPCSMTLPLRLRHSPWIDYLGRRINESRERDVTDQVRIGIISIERPVDRRRSSTLRVAFRQGQGGGLIAMQLQQFLMADEIDDTDEEDQPSEEEDEVPVEYHELMDEGDQNEPGASNDAASEQQQPHDGAAESREASVPQHNEMQQRQEDEGTEESGRNEDAAQGTATATMDDVARVEEKLDQIDQSLDESEELLTKSIRIHRYDHDLSDRLLNISQRLTDARDHHRDSVQHCCRILDRLMRTGNSLEMLRVSMDHHDRQKHQLARIRGLQFRLSRLTRQLRIETDANLDPLIGRIGTVATVSTTFDDSADIMDVGNDDESRNEDRDELIVTVLGTNRFQIVSRVGDEADNGAMNQNLFGGRRNSSHAQVRIYMVRELPDTELPLPPSFVRSQHPKRLLEEADQRYFHHHDQIIQNLANVSSVPHLALKYVWPWRLVGLIRTALDRVPAFDGLTKNLPSLQENSPLLEPTTFSFWMASNMSLSQEEKLILLKMPSTLERLRFILQKVLEQEENETSVCCKSCLSRLSSASEMFTLGGSEGTTGAYVNEYGVIHETITLRNADESILEYSGRPETRDSWFPGYSWTITSCHRCRSHLGWKFHLVRSRAATEDRPEFFFGWSASSVTFRSSSS